MNRDNSTDEEIDDSPPVADSDLDLKPDREPNQESDRQASAGWFATASATDLTAGTTAIRSGRTDQPEAWPAVAVAAGFAASEQEYYDLLHEAATMATREAVREREQADDQQLIHAVRARDDCERTANELAERATEWAGSLFDDVESGIDGARMVANRSPDGKAERRAVSLAARAVALADERDRLDDYIEHVAPAVAPNLSGMAGAALAARLIELAGSLETLAKKPSGTMQVLGAEDALFAHLSGRAPSPKHGVIFTHEFVRNTRSEDRGSAARTFAGKLTLAARVDHYSGTYKEELHEELHARMATIRARAKSGESTTTETVASGDADV